MLHVAKDTPDIRRTYVTRLSLARAHEGSSSCGNTLTVQPVVSRISFTILPCLHRESYKCRQWQGLASRADCLEAAHNQDMSNRQKAAAASSSRMK